MANEIDPQVVQLLKAHGIGVQDALTAVRLLLKEVPLAPQHAADLKLLLDNLVVLPTRVLKELAHGG